MVDSELAKSHVSGRCEELILDKPLAGLSRASKDVARLHDSMLHVGNSVLYYRQATRVYLSDVMLRKNE